LHAPATRASHTHQQVKIFSASEVIHMVTPQDAPTVALPSGSLGLERRYPGASVCIAGIPFDTATTTEAARALDRKQCDTRAGCSGDGAHPRSFADPTSLSLADIGNFRIALGDAAATMSIVEGQARACR
jgi:hypothetical protein